MKACRYHDPDYLSPPEQYAQARCRVEGPPETREPRGGNLGAQTNVGGGFNRQGKPTARERIEQLAAVYGKGGAK